MIHLEIGRSMYCVTGALVIRLRLLIHVQIVWRRQNPDFLTYLHEKIV